MTIMDREWRAGGDLRPSRAGLLLVLLVAAVLRFWALGHGLPFSPGIDEPEVMDRAVRIINTGDYNPHFFDYPSLYIFVQAGVAVFRFVFGALRGEWSSLAQAPTSAFYMWARAVTVLAGMATVWLVFQAGLRWGARTALLAAIFVAIMPNHVRESHYVLTDVPMTFFVALAFLLSLRAHERPTAWAFALAGAAAGLAGATKYTGLLALLMPLMTCWMTPGARLSRPLAMLVAAGGCTAAFLIGSPYTLLDLPAFLNQFARLASEYRTEVPLGEVAWLTYLKHLRNAMQWPASVLVLAGLALGLWRCLRGPARIKWMLATIFPICLFWFISRQFIVYARYLLPIVPFLAILAAAALNSGVSYLRRYEIPRGARNALAAALVLLAFAPPAFTSIQFDRLIAKTWTTGQAYDWVRQQVPASSKVVIESRALLLPPDYQSENVRQLRIKTYDDYSLEGVDYLIASSQCYGPYLSAPGTFPKEYGDYVRLFRSAREVARFAPSRDHPGPELRILKVTP